MHAEYYPMFVSLERRVCLVVGGGPVGERKIRNLLRCRAVIRLVAEELTPWLHAQCHDGTVLLLGNAYTKSYLEDVDLVFAVTNDFALNRLIAGDAESRRLWCNMATEPERGSFIVPSTVQRGPLTIAISTGGASPAMAVRIKQKLEREFGDEWIILLHLMALLRTTIQAKGLESAQNQEIYRNLTELPLLEWIRNEEESQVIQAMSDKCHPWVSLTELKQIWNEAWKQSS
jgi:precorrin-2 dehydrogenase / sirohydrochlorin ferrochelatase